MKKVIFSLTLLLLFTKTFSQDSTFRLSAKEDLLRKSKSQKTTAWILMTAGVTSAIISAATFNMGITSPAGAGDEQGYHEITKVCAIISAGALVSSIAFFVASGRNRRIAGNISLNQERILLPDNIIRNARAFPAASLVIRLNNR